MKNQDELLTRSSEHNSVGNPRFSNPPQGYTLLPQAPLAEPEAYNELYGQNVRAEAARVRSLPTPSP